MYPDYRGQGIGRQVFEAQQRRGAELAGQRHPGHPRIWFADGGIPGASAGLLEVPKPEGIQLLTPAAEMSHELRVLPNVAFADQWGAGEKSERGWKDDRESRTARNQALDCGDYDEVDLGVGSASQTEATRLCEQLGFAVDRTFALYGQAIPTATRP